MPACVVVFFVWEFYSAKFLDSDFRATENLENDFFWPERILTYKVISSSAVNLTTSVAYR